MSLTYLLRTRPVRLRNWGAHPPSGVVGPAPGPTSSRVPSIETRKISAMPECFPPRRGQRRPGRVRSPFGLLCAALLMHSFLSLSSFADGFNDAEDELFPLIGVAPSAGVPKWHVSEPCINLWIYDQPLTYTTSYGDSISFSVAYNQRNNRANDKIFNLSPHWECSWLSYVEYSTNGTNVNVGTTWVKLGGGRTYVADGTSKEYKTGSTMAKLYNGSNFTGFQVSYSSGAKQTYAYLFTVSSSENYAFLSEEVDPVGHTNRFVYDTISNVVRLRTMIDSDNKTNTITYHPTHTRQIKEVEDPYGRKATFGYKSESPNKLETITNVAGMTSTLTPGYDIYYDWVWSESDMQWHWEEVGRNERDEIASVTTPYGTTEFYYTSNLCVQRLVWVTNADGTWDLFAYRDNSAKVNSDPSSANLIPSSYPSNEVPNTGSLSNTFDNSKQNERNSYYWSSLQIQAMLEGYSSFWDWNPEERDGPDPENLGLSDYKVARRRHWLREYNNVATISPVLALEQTPSQAYDLATWGQKVWFDYAGKTNGNWTRGTNASPRFVALVLPDGTSRYTYTEHNLKEKPTLAIGTYTSGSSIATRTNTFTYSTDGIDLIEWRGPSDELISSNAYNSFHQVVTTYNAVNDRTDFTYDSGHRLASVLLPTGLLTTNFFFTSGTNAGWLEKTIDMDNTTSTPIRTNTFTYERALVKTVTDPRGLIVTNTWDDLQRLTAKASSSGTYTYAYNKLDLEKVTDPVGSTNQFTYDPERRPERLIDPHGTTWLAYNCGLLCAMTNALQQTIKYTYDKAGNRTEIIYPDSSKLLQRFNLLNQLTNRTDAATNSINYFYNHQGLLSAASNAVGQLQLLKYDVRDRVTNQVDANGVSVSTTYDALGRVLMRMYPDGGVEKFQYSARGLIAHTNQLEKVTRYGHDVLGRQTAATNANNEVVTYTYNGAGDMISLTDGKGQTTTFGYDQFGRLTSKTNAAGVEVLRFAYDAAGRMTNRWTPAKTNTIYKYDLAHNLTNIVYPVSSNIVFNYDAERRMTSMVDGVGTTTFTYASFGGLRSEDGPWSNDTVTYDYSTNHLRVGMTVQQQDGSSTVQTYAYDLANRLTNVTSAAGGFSYSYQGAGTLVQKLLFPNGAYATNSYDTVGRLTNRLFRTSAEVTLDKYKYDYDLASRRTRVERSTTFEDYAYDAIGQLTNAVCRELDWTWHKHENLGFGYDAAGNLKVRTSNGLTQDIGLNSLNEITNLTRSGTLTLSGNTSIAVTSVTVNGTNAILYSENMFALENVVLTNGNNSFTVIAQDSASRKDSSDPTESNLLSA